VSTGNGNGEKKKGRENPAPTLWTNWTRRGVSLQTTVNNNFPSKI